VGMILGLLSIFGYAASLNGEPLKVIVTIAPQLTFVKKIGGSRVTVQVMVDSGFDPHTYEPKPIQLRELARSSIYFAIGTEFEKLYLNRFKNMNPKINIVHTDKGIQKRSNGADTDDPHIWLSPNLVKKQAETILNALVELDPEYGIIYKNNYLNFIQEIDNLDRELNNILSGIDATIVVFHPTWGYFTDQYGLKQLAIEREGQSPGPAYLVNLIKKLKTMDIETIFIRPGSSQSNANLVAKSIGVFLTEIDPLAVNWSQNLIRFATMIRDSNMKENKEK